MEVPVEVHKIIKCVLLYRVLSFPFSWRCWWHVGEFVINQANDQRCQFDVHCIQYQTSTGILGIVNEFVQYVPSYFQYEYIPI